MTGVSLSDFDLLQSDLVKLTPEQREALENAERPRKIMCLPVKHGVSALNLLAIPLVPMCMMMLSTYMNAQLIFLLRSPDYFDI